MRKTVLITGSSTGIGRETAKYFQSKGWNVSATMRTPSKETELVNLENIICPKLDVTDRNSIEQAIKETIAKFGRIDVLVNNAGYGLTGPFEGASDEQIKRQFDTNVFGLMNSIKAILPHFREYKNGTIVNIASVGGRVTFPLYSLYHATKWAVDGYSESLRFELEPLGIKVKIIEPGVIKTDFYERSNDTTIEQSPEEYREHARLGMKNMGEVGARASLPIHVARAIFKAATDNSEKIRYPVGIDAKTLLALRKFIPDSVYAFIVNKSVFRK